MAQRLVVTARVRRACREPSDAWESSRDGETSLVKAVAVTFSARAAAPSDNSIALPNIREKKPQRSNDEWVLMMAL